MASKTPTTKQAARAAGPIGTALAVMRTATGLASQAGDALKAAQTIGTTIKATRELQDLSLAELARRAGVPKAVVSRVEAGLTSPTTVMLAKLAEGMTVSVSSLLLGDMGPPVHIQQAAEQPFFKDPKSGLVRRTLSPVSPDAAVEIVHNTLPPRRTTPHLAAHAVGTQQHLVVLAGRIEVKSGKREFKLAAGDAAQFAGHLEHIVHNPGPRRAEWLLVIVAPPRPARR